MGRKLRLVDLALLPFGLCVLFLRLLGKSSDLPTSRSLWFSTYGCGLALGTDLSYSSLIPKRLSLRLHYKRCTSTGEEWEVDSDGIEYIPF